MKDISRRNFLRHSLAMASGACCASALGSLGPNIVHAQTQGGNGKMAIFMVLDGGCDSLQSWDIPYNRSGYHDARPDIGLHSGDVLVAESGLGIHPAMTNVHQLYLDGDVAVVRRCGAPGQSRSHDVAQNTMSLGNNGQSGDQRGWMGRAFDLHMRKTVPEM